MRKVPYILAIIFFLCAGYLWAQEGSPAPVQSQFQENTGQVWVPFNGQWLPDVRPELIGPNNYKTQQNLRPVPGGIEGVQGYTQIASRIPNAAMEKEDGSWTTIPGTTPTTSGTTTAQAYKGNMSWVWVCDNAGDYDGIKSDTFNFATQTGVTYQISAWIYPADATGLSVLPEVGRGQGAGTNTLTNNTFLGPLTQNP